MVDSEYNGVAIPNKRLDFFAAGNEAFSGRENEHAPPRAEVRERLQRRPVVHPMREVFRIQRTDEFFVVERLFIGGD